MFHVELRQFPHQARAFNLEREELERRIVQPWVGGATVELQEHRFTPEKAKLTIYEGRELAASEMGLGRGWANVTRVGSEVTSQLLEASRSSASNQLDDLLAALSSRRGPLTLAEAIAIAAELAPGVNAEQAIWQLLTEERLVIGLRPGDG